MSDMKLIMESWREFKKEKRDFPADGVSPIDPSNYGTHAGGAEPQKLVGAPLKNRRQISVYPKPGTLFDPSTGALDQQVAQELLDILDQDRDLMMSEDDPYIDDWLERMSRQFQEAIESLQQKGREEQDAHAETLEAKFKDAVEDIQAILSARTIDTVDITDPKAEIDTIPQEFPKIK